MNQKKHIYYPVFLLSRFIFLFLGNNIYHSYPILFFRWCYDLSRFKNIEVNVMNALYETKYFNSAVKKQYILLGDAFYHLLSDYKIEPKNLIFLCIGSDRSTGDCLGPLIGHKLKKFLPDSFIYGSLEHPVHAKNLEETINSIQKKHPDGFIIAIDASLGQKNHIGYVTLSNRPLTPGLGVDKELLSVGHIALTGIVNINGYANSFILSSTRLNTVMELADFITLGLWYGTKKATNPNYTFA